MKHNPDSIYNNFGIFSIAFIYIFSLWFFVYCTQFGLNSQIGAFTPSGDGLGYVGLLILNIFLFKFFLFNNLVSLFPYVGGLTSQFWFCFYFSSFVILLVFFLNLHFDYVSFVSHLVPLGCPVLLSPFLVLIEIVSFWVRIITLAVRLLINLSAGHVFSHIISGSIYYSGLLVNFVVLCFYLMFEVFVSFIQAGVFSMLAAVYFLL